MDSSRMRTVWVRYSSATTKTHGYDSLAMSARFRPTH